ncbi:sulfite exporter TauE/SafE family protein [Desertimonas flava]|jgi:uncharacterized membrane protein YfcA|uniref:sulfite exporter TauE/SafE family protein n=1 Tax=Desertimonas flava TaxID=2064846 RepID=UPI000E3569BE|nr:sulfite exporter TauE/SafE family protein [Desertimonas flava]
MSGADLTIVAAAVLVAGATHAASGFGFSLLSMPLMSLAIPTREAVVVGTLIGLVLNAWHAWAGRRHIDGAAVRDLTVAAYLGMPFGLALFLVVSDRTLQIILGVAIVVAVVFLLWQREPARTDRRLEYSAGFLSGALNTSLSTNGPPLVFALEARHVSPDRFRGTLAAVFTISNVGAIVAFVAAGKVNRDGLIAAAVAAPAVLAGQALGWPLRRRLHGRRFRYLVLALLCVAAFSAIASAMRS